jgi:hypothetical protein
MHFGKRLSEKLKERAVKRDVSVGELIVEAFLPLTYL